MKILNYSTYIKFSIIFIIVIMTTGLSQDVKLVSFNIQDQFKRVYTEDSWSDSIIIFLGSNSGGSIYNKKWSKDINDSLQILLPKLPVKRIGIADLRGVPFFLKSYFREQFSDDQRIILMDWDGVFPKTYSFTEDASNILIFDLDRNLIYQTSAKEIDKNKLNEIIFAIKKLNGSKYK